MRHSQTNKYIFNSPENVCTFSAGLRKATGRAFQTRGPAAENAENVTNPTTPIPNFGVSLQNGSVKKEEAQLCRARAHQLRISLYCG